MVSLNQLKKIATKIASLEERCQEGCSVRDNLEEVRTLTDGLNMEQLLTLDRLIQKKLEKKKF